MQIANKERGARVRATLVAWKRKLGIAFGIWVLLTALVLGSVVAYAQSKHLSARRANALASSCGTFMGLVLIAGTLVVLVLADRRAPPA